MDGGDDPVDVAVPVEKPVLHDAQRMADVLVSRGLDARVDGRQQPFRVRIGRFATRAEAVRLQQTLKSQGQGGFVTAVPKP